MTSLLEKRILSSGFPDPREADETGLVCAGGDLNVETLISAYQIGVFPWPQEGYPLLWFSPFERGILRFEKLHLSTRFKRELKEPGWRLSFNENFEDVITACAETKRKHEKGTWISREMKAAYTKLHRAGYAHSVECWYEEDLVGGLYGIFLEGVFSGESMFYKKSGASKRSLVFLLEHLHKNGIPWIDTQMVTPVVANLGGELISRGEYYKLLVSSQIRAGHKTNSKIFKKS